MSGNPTAETPAPAHTRRDVLAAAGAFAALGAAPGRVSGRQVPAGSWSPDSLQAAAARKGLVFGSAAVITPLRQDPDYRRALAGECGTLTAENEMKMLYAWPERDRPAYGGGDETVRFARSNGQRMRGHCLVWHRGIPDWALAEMDSARGAEALMRRWIGGIAGRYRGQIAAWDVVNEILAPQEGRADGLRASPWLRALGPRYVDLAFAMVRDADPAAAAVWNEDDLELGADWIEQRRTLVLRTLEGLLRRGVPIRRLGLQGHLYSTVSLDAARLRGFLRAVAGMGLGIEITEFDVDDRAYPADIAARDRGVADFARAFLDVVLDEPAVLSVTTWNITNAGTWLNHAPQRRRPDGLSQRALPLDDTYARTPLWRAMHAAFAAAPDHSAVRAKLRGR